MQTNECFNGCWQTHLACFLFSRALQLSFFICLLLHISFFICSFQSPNLFPPFCLYVGQEEKACSLPLVTEHTQREYACMYLCKTQETEDKLVSLRASSNNV